MKFRVKPLLVLVLVGMVSAAFGATYRVTANAAGGGDGQSWASPISLTNALALAAADSSGSEIWLTSGTYELAEAKTYAFTGSVAIRGGFAGTETSASERAEGTRSTLDGGENVNCLEFSNGASVTVEIDRIRACNGTRGIVKTGAGDLKVVDSEAVGNFTRTANRKGIGFSFTGTSAASLVVSNCVVSGNSSGTNLITNLGYGQGMYVEKFGSAIIADTVFLTNGIAWSGKDFWNEGRDGQQGAALYLKDVAATVSRCRFSANRGSGVTTRGGVARVEGASGGTVFDHCRFVGNVEDYHWFEPNSNNGILSNAGQNGGQLVLNLSSASAVVAVTNCTMAYNLSVNGASGPGITVLKGKLVLRNSIVACNVGNSECTAGADLALLSGNAYADVAYSLLGGNDTTHVTTMYADNLVLGNGVAYGDPLFVSTTEDFDELVVGYGKYTTVNFQLDKERLSDVLALDVHLLSPAGYFDDNGTESTSDDVLSPAIDGGDPSTAIGMEPSPNGGIVNLGIYGGTEFASKTPSGVPAFDGTVTISFEEEYARPTVHFTVGGSGSFYAGANVYISTDNENWVLMETLSGLARGTSVDCLIGAYYSGSIWAKVVLSACGTEVTETSAETTVTKGLPPWTGKGGPANVIHVRPGAIGAGTGENWSDAVSNLRSAFSLVSASKNEIWIAGTNVLTAGSETLSASSALTVRGGFRGWEETTEERPEGFRSVIDGGDVTDCLTVNNSGAVSMERICFIRGLNCGLIKTGVGDMYVVDCHFVTNGLGRATNAAGGNNGKGARVSGKAGTTTITFTNCVFRGNRSPTGTVGYGTLAKGSGVYAEKLKMLRLEDCFFVHNGIPLRQPGYGNSSEPASGDSFGSGVFASAPVSAVGCRFAANFGTVRYQASTTKGAGGAVRLHPGAEGSAFTNCAWVANADQVVWQQDNNAAQTNSAAGALTILFDSNAGTVDVQQCTFAYNLADGYEVTAGINLILGTVNVRNSIFYGNRIGYYSVSRGSDLSLRGDSVCNVAYTLFSEDSTNSISCAATATTNFTGGVIYGDPCFVTEDATVAALVKELPNQNRASNAGGGKITLIFYDWTTDDTYGALESVNVHLRSKHGYLDENSGELVKVAYAELSPAIDAADPAAPYKGEPSGFAGMRANMGFYGNTPYATRSAPVGTLILLR